MLANWSFRKLTCCINMLARHSVKLGESVGSCGVVSELLSVNEGLFRLGGRIAGAGPTIIPS
jgi:hypothetical protein